MTGRLPGLARWRGRCVLAFLMAAVRDERGEVPSSGISGFIVSGLGYVSQPPLVVVAFGHNPHCLAAIFTPTSHTNTSPVAAGRAITRFEQEEGAAGDKRRSRKRLPPCQPISSPAGVMPRTT